jgi:hypothetical protein
MNQRSSDRWTIVRRKIVAKVERSVRIAVPTRKYIDHEGESECGEVGTKIPSGIPAGRDV